MITESIEGHLVSTAMHSLQLVRIAGQRTINWMGTRAVESDFKKSNKSRFKSFLSDFLRGRKPLLLWSF